MDDCQKGGLRQDSGKVLRVGAVRQLVDIVGCFLQQKNRPQAIGGSLRFGDHLGRIGLTQSEFFREHVLANTTQVVAKPKASADSLRAVYLLQKASNNINQLAHRANSEHLAGVLSEATFLAIVNQLEQLNQFMLEQTGETQK